MTSSIRMYISVIRVSNGYLQPIILKAVYVTYHLSKGGRSLLARTCNSTTYVHM